LGDKASKKLSLVGIGCIASWVAIVIVVVLLVIWWGFFLRALGDAMPLSA
jgi:hypothetical protein